MTAIELKMSLLQEVMSLEDEKLIKKALNSVRRMKMAAFGKATPASSNEAPTKTIAERRSFDRSALKERFRISRAIPAATSRTGIRKDLRRR